MPTWEAIRLTIIEAIAPTKVTITISPPLSHIKLVPSSIDFFEALSITFVVSVAISLFPASLIASFTISDIRSGNFRFENACMQSIIIANTINALNGFKVLKNNFIFSYSFSLLF